MWLSQIEKMSSKQVHFSRKRAFSRIKFYLTQLFRPLFPGLFRHGAVPIGRWLSAVRRLEALASIFEGYEAESSAEIDDFEEENVQALYKMKICFATLPRGASLPSYV